MAQIADRTLDVLPGLSAAVAFGGTTIGCAIDAILLGILSTMMSTYFEARWRKEPVLNAVVVLLGLLSVIAFILNLAGLWSISIEPTLSPAGWLFRNLLVDHLVAARFSFSALRIVAAQMCFTWRLFKIGGWWWLCLALGLGSVGLFMLMVVPMGLVSTGHSIMPLAGKSQTAGPTAVGDYALASIEAFLGIDIILTVSITYLLLKYRRLTTNANTESLLTRIATAVLSNALICALLNTATVVSFHYEPIGASFHDCFATITATTFSVCLLLNLNQRGTLLRNHDPAQLSHSTPVSRSKHAAPAVLPSFLDIHTAVMEEEERTKSWKDERRFESSLGSFAGSPDELQATTP